MASHNYDYDLFVIGGGSGGVRAARISSQHGAKVGLAEYDRYGGTCVIRGCVPKKLMVYASRFANEFEEASGYGWTVGERSFDWSTLIGRKDEEIDRLEEIYRTNLKKAGVTLFDAHARFADAHTLILKSGDGSEQKVTADRILIATGGYPKLDDRLPGMEHAITSNAVFHLDEMPKRIVIAGGGYIAVEFASIFCGLGADTTLIYRGDEILRGFDDEVRTFTREQLERKGLKVILGEVFTKLEETPQGLVGHTSGGKVLEADQIMFAIGRNPNVHGLGLQGVGVAQGAKGEIIVDAFSQTSQDHIYAVGDVTDRINLTPVAIREGHAFADTVFGGMPTRMDHADVATAVFTTPEIGTVGLTEQEARATHQMVDIYRTDFRTMKKAFPGSSERMLMKIVVDGQTDRVLGVHVVGDGAGEMSQLLGIAIKMGATKADFDRTVAVHPTAAEELVTLRTRSERYMKDAAE
ncbi:MAG: glutathione-disulfide reductase [Pseudomonadota bacterium]